jgi:MFS family permease
MKLSSIYRSLQYPNYRLYFIGQSVSLIGTWMQRIAISWLVYRLTHSASMLGIVTFAGLIPTFLLSPYGGVITDRVDRFKILLATQIAAMIQASILAGIILAGYYNINVIIVLSVVLGIINAFDTPSRQSLVVSLVDDKTALPNAIALNSSMVHMARFIGPSIAGIIVAKFGEGICFLLNAVSFIAVIASLLLMKLKKEPIKKSGKKVWEDFAEGFVYLRQSVPLRRVIIMLGLISLIMMPFATLLPVFAKDIFKGDATTYGHINAVSGLGALIGTFYLATLKTSKFLSKILLIAAFIFGCGLILFSLSTNLYIALGCMVLAGFGMMLCIAAGNTFVQTNVSDQMRGRVMSFYAMAFFGMQPIGSLFVGVIAKYIGARTTLAIQGAAGVLIAIIFVPFLLKKKTAPASLTEIPTSPDGTAAIPSVPDTLKDKQG